MTAPEPLLAPCPLATEGNHFVEMCSIPSQHPEVADVHNVYCSCGMHGPICNTASEAAREWNTRRPSPTPIPEGPTACTHDPVYVDQSTLDGCTDTPDAAVLRLRVTEWPTPYDQAVGALAPYLPDGWVAYEDNDTFWYYEGEEKPEIKDIFGNRNLGFAQGHFLGHSQAFKPPRPDDWRTSLRRVEKGRMVG